MEAGAGGRELIKSPFHSLDSLLIRVPLWKLNNLCIHSASIRLSTLHPQNFTFGGFAHLRSQTLIGQRPCKLSLGGPCSTEVAAPPTESIGLPSRLCSLEAGK